MMRRKPKEWLHVKHETVATCSANAFCVLFAEPHTSSPREFGLTTKLLMRYQLSQTAPRVCAKDVSTNTALLTVKTSASRPVFLRRPLQRFSAQK